MNNYKAAILLTVLIFIPSPALSAPEISSESFFTVNEMNLAAGGEFLVSVLLKGKGAVTSKGVEITTPVKNSFIRESSSAYDMTAVEKGFFFMDGNRESRMKLYRALTDVNALKGMSYYSKSDGKNAALVIDSYRIQSADDYIKENVNDKNIPEKVSAHIAIKDNRLGLLTFRSELLCNGDNFIMINISTGTASKFGMDIFYPGDYRIYKILIYDRKLKGYFFYTVQYMKVRSSILGRFDLIKPESFGNRIRAENVHFLKSIGINRADKLAAFR